MTLFSFKIDGYSPRAIEKLIKLARGTHNTSAHLHKKSADMSSDPDAPFGFRLLSSLQTSWGVTSGNRKLLTLAKGIVWQACKG